MKCKCYQNKCCHHLVGMKLCRCTYCNFSDACLWLVVEWQLWKVIMGIKVVLQNCLQWLPWPGIKVETIILTLSYLGYTTTWMKSKTTKNLYSSFVTLLLGYFQVKSKINLQAGDVWSTFEHFSILSAVKGALESQNLSPSVCQIIYLKHL